MNSLLRKNICIVFITVLLMACQNPEVEPSNVSDSELRQADISLSGLSSGAYMALQFHLSHSERVIGSGLIAGGPYFCAEGSIGTALQNCVADPNATIDLAVLAQTYDKYQQNGLVSARSYNSDDKVWLLHGTLDTRINRRVAESLSTQLKTIFAPENITFIRDKAFSHLMPTLNEGASCSESTSPFIGNCNFDAAGELLQQVAKITKPKSDVASAELNKKIITFKQADYAGDNAVTLGDEGYLFFPESCKTTNCDIHISFHGCKQNAESIGDEYAKNAGFNAWAQSNQLIVLYPQTKKSSFMPLNPQACWDWWGYTGENYANKEGKQIKAVMSLVENIMLIVSDNEKTSS